MPAALPFITAATAVAGIGLQVYGMSKQADAQKAMAAEQQHQIQLQQQGEAQKQKAMELDARRRQMEIFRQQQRVRAMSLTTATSQGAQLGSGLPGAYGQAAGQAGVQGLGVMQNLQIGRAISDINAQISGSKIAYSEAQSNALTGNAISAFGGTLLSNLGTITNLGRTYLPSSVSTPYSNPSAAYGNNAYNPGFAGSIY